MARTSLYLKPFELAIAGMNAVNTTLDTFLDDQFIADPRATNHPIMVIPGFLAGDYTTIPIRRGLDKIGFTTAPSGYWLSNQGPNKRDGIPGRIVIENLEKLCEETNRKSTLVGWSLGGMIARETARERPDLVLNVITLVSPFANVLNCSPDLVFLRKYVIEPIRLFRGIELTEDLSRKVALPIEGVPHYNIFSEADGLVDWNSCVCPERSEIIRLKNNDENHFSLPLSSEVIKLMADYALRDSPANFRNYKSVA